MVDIGGIVEKTVLGIVAIIVLFLLIGGLSPSITDAADNISSSGLPYPNSISC